MDESHSRRYLIGALLLALFTLVMHDVFGEHGYLALRKSKRESEELQKQLQALTEENKRLAAEIKALKSDPQTIEKIAREEMKLARPGEIVYTLPSNNRAKPGPPDRPAEPQKKAP